MKKLIPWSLAGALLLTTAPAFAQDKAAPAAPAEAAPASKSTVTVKLIEPGQEPRKELRYTPKAGATSTMTMRMKMTTKAEVAGRPMDMSMPAMLMTVDMTVKEVRPNGDIAYDAVFSNMDVEAAQDANPMIVDGMRTALTSMKGTQVSAVMTSRGETIQADFKLPPGANQQSRQMMDSLRQSVSQLSAPLPAEAVGKGAKWDVHNDVNNMGMSIDQTSTMTLKDLSGPAFTVDVALTQTADKQDVSMPGMPPGIKVQLISLKTTGTGELRGSTDSVLPIESRLTMNSNQEMQVTPGEGQPPQQMKQGLTMELSMKSGAPAKDAAKDTGKDTPAAPAK